MLLRCSNSHAALVTLVETSVASHQVVSRATTYPHGVNADKGGLLYTDLHITAPSRSVRLKLKGLGEGIRTGATRT